MPLLHDYTAAIDDAYVAETTGTVDDYSMRTSIESMG